MPTSRRTPGRSARGAKKQQREAPTVSTRHVEAYPPEATPVPEDNIPTIEKIEATANELSRSDRVLFRSLLKQLESNLGSAEASRLWLVTHFPEFETTPLDAVKQGKANLVLALLESQWGPGPTYA